MLNVQKFIIENGIKKLEEDLSIQVNHYLKEKLITLNYSQIDSSKHDPIVKECRGLILSSEYPYDVVSRAYDRFFNYNECPRSSEFNIRKYIAWEKLDGSLISVYNHNGKWGASTRKMAFAEGRNTQGFLFNDLVNEAINWNKLEYVNPELTLIFELVSNKNRIVKRYNETKVFLTGIRNKKTGKEFNYQELVEFAYNFHFELPQQYSFKSHDDIIKSFGKIDPFDEGYVCVNYDNMHRIKIKNPSYLAIAHLRNNGVISPKRIISLVMNQDHEEYLSVFPEDREFFEPYIIAHKKLSDDIHETYKKYQHVTDQKEFAMAIQNNPCKNILFMLKRGHTLDDIFEKMTENSKINLLESYK